jgi:uncharacterized protein YjbJ (UPF0337 family)
MRYILLITALLTSSVIFGQRGEGRSDERRDKIESMRVAYITDKMHLSAEDAQVFWPIMNKYEDKYKSMRGDAKQRLGEDVSDMNESDAKEMYTQRLNIAQTRIDLTKQLVGELEQHLTSVQILNYLKAEDNFKKEVLGKVRERMGERRAGDKGDK